MNDIRSERGFSLVEVILAAALFVILATSSIAVIIQGYNANRLGTETTIASQFASEGIEAVKSIKNQAYANLVNTAGCGLQRNGSNVWAFQSSCTNNTLTHNSTDNYIRTIKVEDVNRDATPPSGNIVASGGTLDSDTKKITSTVTWNFTGAVAQSVSLITYLSDWRKAIAAADDGLIVYGDTTAATIPKYRLYSNSSDTFGSELNAPTGTAVAKNVVVRTSPTKKEAIAGYVYTSGTTATLQIMCFNGVSWTNDWSVQVNSAATANTKKFSIAYETTSGDVMVAYSRNTTATNAVDYRTKLGSTGCGTANWSSAASLPTTIIATSGNVQWLRMASDPRSGQNIIALTWADINSDLGVAVWTGSAWSTTNSFKVLETALEVASAAQDVEPFDVTFESLTGNLMVAWGSGGTQNANGAFYAICSGGTANCTWGAKTAITSMANDATNLDISSNPSSNEIVFASIGNGGSDLQVAYWSGSTWTGTNDIDNTASTPLAATKLVATGWVTNGVTRSIVVYMDSTGTAVSWYVGTNGVFTKQTDWAPTPVFGNPKKWMDIMMDPKNPDRLMLVISDLNNDLWAKRLVMSSGAASFTWSDSDTPGPLEANLGQATANPFGFAYWRNP